MLLMLFYYQKIKAPNCVTDFRPISLLNVVYKIVIEIFTIRLNFVLNDLVDIARPGFIKERFILDGIVSIQEFVCLEEKKQKRKG